MTSLTNMRICYLVTNAHRTQRSNIFFEQNVRFLWKKIRMFSCLRWRKSFIIRNLKLWPLTIRNLIFSLKMRKMSFDDKEFCRIILNYWVACKHEENHWLFICIFKIDPVETVELIFNFDLKNRKKIAINVSLLNNFWWTLFCIIIGILFRLLT